MKEILYGKTEKIILADGKEYTFREPDLTTLEDSDLDMSKLAETSNIRKLAYIMTKDDHPGMSEKQIGRLITFGMLNEGNPFFSKVLGLLGKDQKNE